MSIYRLYIKTDNDAFSTSPGAEVARILRELADQCELHDDLTTCSLADYNGNAVGKAYIAQRGQGPDEAEGGADGDYL